MKKLKLDVAQVQVLSFTMEAAMGGGTVNAHGWPDTDNCWYGDQTAGTSGTDIFMTCASCPRFCFEDPASLGPETV